MKKRLIAIVCSGVLYLACASDAEDGEGGGGSSPQGSGASASTPASGSSSGGNSEACRSDDASLTTSCEQLCDRFLAADCQLLDLSVPYIYRLYVNSGESRAACVSECVAGDLRQGALVDAPDKCGPELSQYIARAATKTCVNRNAAKNFQGQWDWTGTEDASATLTACGERCLDLPTCSSSTCNGSMSAGSVSCSWSCSGRTCEQSCN
jgi:hypothetical protein